MKRTIPGLIDVIGREFFYMQSFDGEDFRVLIDAALSSRPDMAMPTSGGIIEEKTNIIYSENINLAGVSYKGDLDGWRNKLIAFCELQDRVYGLVTSQVLSLSNGETVKISECKVVFGR